MLRDGLKAATIRVNDIDGVGGFVLPGDHVDVALTRQVDKTNGSTEVVLQNVRVLAIDQIADERSTSRPWSRRSRSRSTWSARRSCRWPPRSAACR
jgi:Flp pilus assembly protein CpaB